MLIIKKIFAFLLAALLLSPNSSAAAEMPSVSANCAVLSCGGRLIYEKKADTPVAMASTTKLMTAILAIENCSLDESVLIRQEYCGIEGSSMYLRPDTKKSVEELLQGLLLVSGNDAATALACHVSGSEEGFVKLMNDKAQALGMTNTHFVNPHGLSDKEHYSTARDLAMLMEYCMKNTDFQRINAMKSCHVDGSTLVNHNKLLFNCPGCVGGKTGFTEAAGRCLVSCCEREGGLLVCVTLSAPDDWNDHKKLYNWGFELCSLRSMSADIDLDVPLIAGEKNGCALEPEGEYSLFLPDECKAELKAEVPWYAFAPVKRGQRAGKVRIFVDGQAAGEYYLMYSEDVPVRDLN